MMAHFIISIEETQINIHFPDCKIIDKLRNIIQIELERNPDEKVFIEKLNIINNAIPL